MLRRGTPSLLERGTGGEALKSPIRFVLCTPMTSEKFNMFHNRLTKVYRHIGKQARRQGITCYRVYDHDLPEFPFCIEIYEDKIYLAEYKRRLEMGEEAHEDWLDTCIIMICEI